MQHYETKYAYFETSMHLRQQENAQIDISKVTSEVKIYENCESTDVRISSVHHKTKKCEKLTFSHKIGARGKPSTYVYRAE